MALTKVLPSMISGSAGDQFTNLMIRSAPVSPLDYGAVGDNVADDTTAMQNAINAAANGCLDLLNKTYKITSSLSLPSNFVMRNGTLDGSGMADYDTLLEVTGTLGSSKVMNTISSGVDSFVVSDATGIATDVMLYLQSNTVFGVGGSTNGELIKVRTVSGTTVTPYRRVFDYYQSSPVFFIPQMKRNILLSNIQLIGGGLGKAQVGVNIYLAENVVLEGCNSYFFADRHFQFLRSANCRASYCGAYHSDQSTGLAYGFTALNGCNNITINGCVGYDHRHGFATGAENGVDRNITVTGCTFTACTDAPLDSHPQAQFIVFNGNVCGGDSTETSQDGISAQGTDMVISNNIVQGFSRAGILLQPSCTNVNISDTTSCVGNTVTRPISLTDAYGISYENLRTGDNAQLNISNNTVNMLFTNSGNGILVEQAASSGSMFSLVISNNSVYVRHAGLTVVNRSSVKLMRGVAISGNAIQTTSANTYDAIVLVAITANYIERALLTGNNTYGGRYGINNSNGDRVVAYANMLQAFGTAATNNLTASANNYSS